MGGEVVKSELTPKSRFLLPLYCTKPWGFNSFLTFGTKKELINPPHRQETDSFLAGLFSDTSPGQLAFRCPTLEKEKVGFRNRASEHSWATDGTKMWTTFSSEKSENLAVGWRVSSSWTGVPEERPPESSSKASARPLVPSYLLLHAKVSFPIALSSKRSQGWNKVEASGS